MKYRSELPVINFNWVTDVPDTVREVTVDPILLEETFVILPNVIDGWGIFEGKPGSCTFAWSTKVTWLNQKEK